MDRSRTYEYGGIYACKDGYVILYPREDRQWRVLVEIMGRPELADDERYVTRADRIRHGDEVNRIIGEWAAGIDQRGGLLQGGAQRMPGGLLCHG